MTSATVLYGFRVAVRRGFLSATLALLAPLLWVATANAQATACPNGVLPPGSGGNLVIAGVTCQVNAGTYLYTNVNIILGGKLVFADADIDFWAESILVENTGSLIAGTASAPIGTSGGEVTIHLWGADQGTSGNGGQGIPCMTPTVPNKTGPCGIPLGIWTSNLANQWAPTSCNKMTFSNGVSDCFYQYMPLDYDGGGTTPGYFGYKVIGVSYGGTLELFGAKGASSTPLPVSSSGKSWARLNGTVNTNDTTLVVDRSVNWAVGDQIVLTTTDYLPGHSEVLDITSISSNNTITFTRDSGNLPCPISGYTGGACYTHNGQTYDLSSVPKGIGPDKDLSQTCYSSTTTQTRCVETRAAVGLLTRSIRIVSGGDTIQSPFPAADGCPSYFFGGHTIVRQGFQSFQVQGVEFYQLGEGGRIMHYPVHFHMARQVPSNTFVEDSSVWDSMTRMYTIHATSGVTLARNVGFLSIGHGYYLEDGTETNNQLNANLAVFARAAVENDQNPRCVPGIFGATHNETDQVPETTDMDHPTPFWITNGWNDFRYNAAIGAGTCGVCYWALPAGNSGYSQKEYWGTSYAAEQLVTNNSGGYVPTRSGTTPLKSFVGNSCVASEYALQVIAPLVACEGVNPTGDTGAPVIPSINNPLSPPPNNYNQQTYYPLIDQGTGRTPTECPSGLDCSCSAQPCPSGLAPVGTCSNGTEQYCTITAVDHFTDSFNWADTNLAAIWLRPQWYLMSNSAVTDVQNGGVTFVSGGGYTASDEIPGYWALSHKNAFVGTTQPSNNLASNAGPFNINSLKIYPQLTCALRTDNGQPEATYCLNTNEGISMPLENFAMNQRLFNIYDGPSFQDSDAFLDITPTTLTNCTPGQGSTCQMNGWMYGNSLGVPEDLSSQACYLPNAAIAWKQPNGFYYPPEFHSRNLYFNSNVTIRHFVIEPLFETGSYEPNTSLIASRYCVGNTAMFNNFTDIDRQTELSDDDGSLTGLLGGSILPTALHRPAISVNKDAFFDVPIETVECASDIKDNMPQPWGTCGGSGSAELCGTANTSPYDYVTTVVYPDCGNDCDQTEWNLLCQNPDCYGVPLYREGLVPADNGTAPFIRMAGQSTGQRSTLTVNNGNYYMDTNVSQDFQSMWSPPGGTHCSEPGNGNATCNNVFQGGHTYYTFLLYAKATTVQTYSMYVGTDFDPTSTENLYVARVDKSGVPYGFATDTHSIGLCSAQKPDPNFPWCYTFNSTTGILSVTMNMGFPDFVSNVGLAKQNSCEPQSYCSWSGSSCSCALSNTAPGYEECQNTCSKWAGKAIDCPWDASYPGGARAACYGFAVKMPGDFMASANGTSSPPGQCVPNNSTWNAPFTASQNNAGSCAYTSGMLPTGSFCDSAPKR
jgi:hypothetical protein